MSRKFEERVFGYDDGFEREQIDTRWFQLDVWFENIQQGLMQYFECEMRCKFQLNVMMIWRTSIQKFENIQQGPEWCSTLSVDRGVWGRVTGYLGKNASRKFEERVFGYDDGFEREPENKSMWVENDFRWMFWFENIQQGPEWCSTLSVDRGVWGRVSGYLSKNASRKFEERVFGYDDGFERDTREQIDLAELKMF